MGQRHQIYVVRKQKDKYSALGSLHGSAQYFRAIGAWSMTASLERILLSSYGPQLTETHTKEIKRGTEF